MIAYIDVKLTRYIHTLRHTYTTLEALGLTLARQNNVCTMASVVRCAIHACARMFERLPARVGRCGNLADRAVRRRRHWRHHVGMAVCHLRGLDGALLVLDNVAGPLLHRVVQGLGQRDDDRRRGVARRCSLRYRMARGSTHNSY